MRQLKDCHPEEPSRSEGDEGSRFHAWVEVDLAAIAHNFRVVRRLTDPHSKIFSIVKSDAYGHGLMPVARVLARAGSDAFGVGSVEEGLRLREAGVRRPILVFGVPSAKEIGEACRSNLSLTVFSESLVKEIGRAAGRLGKPVSVHLKIDSGMGRLGLPAEKASIFASFLAKYPRLAWEGVYTHLPSADCDPDFTRRQIRWFEGFRKAAVRWGNGRRPAPFFHGANSAGILFSKSAHFDAVRPGLLLYGISPKDGRRLDLRPALSFKTRVVLVKDLPPGQGIGYGRTFITKKPTRVATLSVGYANGYFRLLSNKGSVLIRGRRCPILGTVTMDYVMADVSRVPDVRAGDVATLVGRDRSEEISARQIASLCGTIPYEVVCSVGSQNPRAYTVADD